jgi:hypothetical protein
MGSLGSYFRLGLCTVLLLALSVVFVERTCHAGDYLGEYCWDGDDGSFARLGITLMGDGHFTFSGRVTDPGSGGDFPVHGSFEIVGSSVKMIVVASQTQSDVVVSSLGNIVLDTSTLDGTSDLIHWRYEAGVIYVDHEAHDLFSTNCDMSLSEDGSDKREELKRILKEYVTSNE